MTSAFDPAALPYFAFGANLDEAEMAHRCPGARSTGVARLPGWRFLTNCRGWGTIVPAPGCVVYGLLWQVTAADVASLDDYEGLPEGLYRRDQIEVFALDGRTVNAWAYFATDSEPGPPQPGYLEQVSAAAARLGLPAEYVAELRAGRTA
ncbi:MAG: gamma-glutamylcyclotransferase family protein [Limisphaerales bacterium]